MLPILKPPLKNVIHKLIDKLCNQSQAKQIIRKYLHISSRLAVTDHSPKTPYSIWEMVQPWELDLYLVGGWWTLSMLGTLGVLSIALLVVDLGMAMPRVSAGGSVLVFILLVFNTSLFLNSYNCMYCDIF